DVLNTITPERFQAAVNDAKSATPYSKNVGFGQLEQMFGNIDVAKRIVPMLSTQLGIDRKLVREGMQAYERGSALGVTAGKQDLSAEIDVDLERFQALGSRIADLDEMFSKLGKTTEMLTDQKRDYA